MICDRQTMFRLFVLTVFAIAILVSKNTNAANVIFSGSVNQNDNPAKVIIQVIKPGFPFQGVEPSDSSWVLLGETSSSAVDGAYSLTADVVGSVLVLAYYKGLNYSVVRKYDITTQVQITEIDFTLPDFNANNISMDIRVFEGPVGQEKEINYNARQYQLLLVYGQESIDNRIVDFTNHDYKMERNNIIYDLPDGSYKIICALNNTDGAGFKYAVTDVMLPLPTVGRIHSIYFR